MDGRCVTASFDCANGFLKEFRNACKGETDCLILSSDPENTRMGDEMRDFFVDAFVKSGMSVARVDVCDKRDQGLVKQLCCYGLLILAGGHVPTQNAFFRQIGLREKIHRYAGVVLGISAGTMNCAEVVYAQPELPGESCDPGYRRFLEGLGLTDLQILPHYQEVKDNLLDGRRLIEDITCEDSYGRTLYALVDGSYVLCDGRRQILFGEAWRIRDGVITKICEKGQRIEL